MNNLPPELTAKCLELAGLPADAVMPAKRRKWNNTPTVVNGVRFDSAKEADHWVKLQALARDGLIWELRRQVTYELRVRGWLICRYKADFVFRDAKGEHVQDVKGYATREYKLKKRLMLACLGIEIQEV